MRQFAKILLQAFAWPIKAAARPILSRLRDYFVAPLRTDIAELRREVRQLRPNIENSGFVSSQSDAHTKLLESVLVSLAISKKSQ